MSANMEAFWALYVEHKYDEWFCRHLKDEARRWNTIILFSCTLVSLGSVSAWSVWTAVPWLWAIIVMVMQAVQAYRPYFPFFDRLTAFKYFLPQLSNILINMENDWLRIEAYSPEQIADLILEYKRQYRSLDCTYLECIHIPISGRTYERVSRKAAQQCLVFFSQKYNVGGEIIGTSTQSQTTTNPTPSTSTSASPTSKSSADAF